jgi:Fe2+ or Zn2+ uptake regulation protein
VLEGRLRDAGLRVTRPRLTVLQVLTEASASHEHLSTADVATRARASLPTLSTQAVYDCLDALTGARLLRRIEPAGSPARYETRVADNHHHLVCRSCGVVRDVDCATGAAPCLEPPAGSGFVVDEAEVVFWGLCPRCTAHAVHQTVTHTATKENQVR